MWLTEPNGKDNSGVAKHVARATKLVEIEWRSTETDAAPEAPSSLQTPPASLLMETRLCGVCCQTMPISHYTERAKSTCLKCITMKRKQHANRQARKNKQKAAVEAENRAMETTITEQSVEYKRLQNVLAALHAPGADTLDDQILRELCTRPSSTTPTNQLLEMPLPTQPPPNLLGSDGLPPTEPGFWIKQEKHTSNQPEDLTRDQQHVSIATQQAQSKPGSNCDGNPQRQKYIVDGSHGEAHCAGTEQLLRGNIQQAVGGAIDVDSDMIDLDMFEVAFLEETENDSSGTSSIPELPYGNGVGSSTVLHEEGHNCLTATSWYLAVLGLTS